MKPIRVLIVDDSATVRRILADALATSPGIQVVGTAGDPYEARDKILELNPDVVTLDIEMPRMDGLTFLKRIMRFHPLPVIIVSSLGQAGCKFALDALESGAIDVLAKPNGPASVGELPSVLPAKIRAAASANYRVARGGATPGVLDGRSFAQGLILIGASTGGTDAIAQVLRQFPSNAPPVLVAQHLPPKFSKAFADRLNDHCAIEVREAVDGDVYRPGLALVAPGDSHLLVRSMDRVALNQGPRVHYQRPAVDVLFTSAVEAGHQRMAAALLTGMGADGAAGLLRLRKVGAVTIAQDEATCVVFGMPGEAIRMGAAQQILPLSRVADALLSAMAAPGSHRLAPALSR